MKIKDAIKPMIGEYVKSRVPHVADNAANGNPDDDTRKFIRLARRDFNRTMETIDSLPDAVRYEVFTAIHAAFRIGLFASSEDERLELVNKAKRSGRMGGATQKQRADDQWRNRARELDVKAKAAGHSKPTHRARYIRENWNGKIDLPLDNKDIIRAIEPKKDKSALLSDKSAL
ncbi:hypothetical protein A1351_11305 [Methylosinus sp. R-45379]|uniref:hypothetical protein n=1 Tax=Methylosinus sp. R-45379 TaxID=980563 RepID=UPI0007C93C79|nr:hypothetical protein [Methylosinus sp. R-45379]OAI28684.1 hypothetical protein A1351_11305 [Methylosinus sp. R-45379]